MTFVRISTSLGLFAIAAIAAIAALGGSLAAAGCEVIVPNDVPTPTCTMTPFSDPGNGTCPRGMYCEGGGCKACQTRDICDGYDNDCDGIIDDGPYSDKDQDGYTICGKTSQTTGAITERDCVDDDAKIYPGADEICNGKDDNCDGIIDNKNLVCPPNETCVPQTGQCISTAAACFTCDASDAPGCCAAPNICDPGTQQCVPRGTQDAGTSCSGNLACTTGICTDPAELGAGTSVGSVATCTKPCCTSADCDPGSICWGAGTGGNYCLDATTAGRSAPGTASPGESCTANTDCRSGVCTGDRCEDTCCMNSDCSNGTSCAVTTTFGGQNLTLACVVPSGNAGSNQNCDSNPQCASGFCAGYIATTGTRSETINACAQPCCNSNQCGSLEGDQLLCYDDYLPPSGSGPVVPVCDNPQQEPGTGGVGSACPNGAADCFSNQCLPSGYCTDVCCTDADCNSAPGWVCRPTQIGTGTFLRCVPNPQP